jgi:uncharacterized protein VirK/YbjX
MSEQPSSFPTPVLVRSRTVDSWTPASPVVLPFPSQAALQRYATREDVIDCYHAVLGREPESEAAIEGHLASQPCVKDVIARLSHSSELRAKHLRTNIALDRAREPNFLARSLHGVDSVRCYYGHYGALAEALKPEALEALITGPVRLYAHQVGNVFCEVVLTATHERHDEGELQLQFLRDGALLYLMGVSVVPGDVLRLPERHVMLISRMQGAPRRFAEIRQATKEFSEIHPQALLLAALQGLAQAMDLSVIAGVSATNQLVYDAEHAELFERAYDAFFLSAGATAWTDRYFLLNADGPRRTSVPKSRSHALRALRKRRAKDEIIAQTAECARELLRPLPARATPAIKWSGWRWLAGASHRRARRGPAL